MITNLETELRLHLQRRLVLLTPETNPRFQLSELLATGAFIHPPLVEMREDRFRAAHYASGDADAMRKRWTERLRTRMRVIDDRELRELSDTVAGWVRRIRARGGEVIFVRIPSSSTVLDAEAELWPRERFWDVFVREAQVKAIYFADEPTLRDIQAAEGSHLDAAEAAEFSAQLARILRARGWIHVRQ